MNYLLAFILLIVVFILTNEREAYDMFGFSGYVVPKQTQLMDPYPELKGYDQVKTTLQRTLWRVWSCSQTKKFIREPG